MSDGLVQFEDPGLGVPDARPLWCSAAHPYVLEVEPAGSDRRTDAFDLDRLRPLARLVPSSDAEHLLLSDGLRTVRLDGPPGCFGSAPACLRFRIVGIASAEAPLLALRRLLALCRTGGFARSLHRPEPRAARWVWVLRAADGLAQGADQREIAAALLSRSALDPLWRTRESSVRSRVQRLVRAARELSEGGWRTLLE